MEENNNLENIVPRSGSTSSTGDVPIVSTSVSTGTSNLENAISLGEEDALIKEIEEVKHRELLSDLGHPNLPEEVIIKTFKENAAERNILLEANMIYTMKTIESLKALGYEMEEKD